ncbi:hypothetical protein [Prochlorococcus marinus]|uniref:hypothetical protein n=1 Tax=Prochlorococcus marinus TaxID=1219 RepID=UPI0001900481|nr:hypothetical protein [Prochlorococcus marinus]EEE39773.1 hypothetical protein P9202_546 [Prochlorococcus marinus str. MIT 9202]
MLEPFVPGLLDRLKTQPKEIQIALTIEDFVELSSKGSNTLILDSALLIKVNFSIKKSLTSPFSKSGIIPITQPFKKLSTTYGVCKYLKITIDGVVCFCLICHYRSPHHLGS